MATTFMALSPPRKDCSQFCEPSKRLSLEAGHPSTGRNSTDQKRFPFSWSQRILSPIISIMGSITCSTAAWTGSLEEVISFVRLLSESLSRSGIEHFFEVYDNQQLVQ